MADVRQSAGLQIIFAIFLGLMVTAFVGVGVHTFHPSSEEEYNRQTRELSRQEQAIRNFRAPEDLTPEERARMQELRDERNRTRDAQRFAMRSWGRTTSILLIAFATLAMVASLVRAERLPVISNGLLLGGVFTMIHGVGLSIATDTSISRFLVMTIALVITLVLGYVRFVRSQAPSTARDEARIAGSEGLAQLEPRIRALEQRMEDAANALGHKGDASR